MITISKIYYAKGTPYTWCYCLSKTTNASLRALLRTDTVEKGTWRGGDAYMGNCSKRICSIHTYRAHCSPCSTPTLWVDRSNYTFSSSPCVYKAHCWLYTIQPQKEGWWGIIWIGLTGANLTCKGGVGCLQYVKHTTWRTWRLTPSPKPGQASSLANNSQDRYTARLANLASGQKAEETRNSSYTKACF